MNKFYLLTIGLLSCMLPICGNIISYNSITQTYVVDQYGAPVMIQSKNERPSCSAIERKESLKSKVQGSGRFFSKKTLRVKARD